MIVLQSCNSDADFSSSNNVPNPTHSTISQLEMQLKASRTPDPSASREANRNAIIIERLEQQIKVWEKVVLLAPAFLLLSASQL